MSDGYPYQEDHNFERGVHWGFYLGIGASLAAQIFVAILIWAFI